VENHDHSDGSGAHEDIRDPVCGTSQVKRHPDAAGENEEQSDILLQRKGTIHFHSGQWSQAVGKNATQKVNTLQVLPDSGW
jgi:hypothetical protein